MKKVLFFDIDGTIMHGVGKKIEDSTRNALKKAQANGHLILINTGRTRCLIDKELEEMEFDGYICGCGTYIEINGEVLYHNKLSRELQDEMLKKLKATDVEFTLEGTSAIYVDYESANEDRIKMIKRFEDSGYNIESCKSEYLEYDKVFGEMNDRSYLPELEKFFAKNDLEYIDRGNDMIEIIPRGHSKATGMDFLLNHLNIDKEHSFVFGDSYNDVAMFEYCPNSILMGNGKMDLANMVKFVTKDIDNDGIKYALEHFNII